MASHLHRAHGLNLHSDLDLDGFAPAARQGSADVRILRGGVPIPGADLAPLPYGAARPGLFVLEAGPGGRFLVEEGCRITVEAGPDLDPALVLLYLAGPAMASLLIQRGYLVLHGNALEFGGRGLVVCGPPASGKSAVSAVLLEQGGRLLADDVSSIHPAESSLVHPGCGPLKVRKGGLEEAGLAGAGWVPLRPDADRSVRPVELGLQPVPLEAVYLLGGSGSEPLRLRGRRIVQKAPLFVYRPELVAALGRSGDVLLALGALARQVRFVELPQGKPARTAEAVRSNLGSSLGGTAPGRP